MEDAHTINHDFAGKEGYGLFAIFDGHGGRTAADWCGKNFHRMVEECLQQHPELAPAELLNAAFLQADSNLTPENSIYSGCTVIAAYITAAEGATAKDTKLTLYTANVGDARAVLCRKGKAVRLSYDHKGTDEREHDRIVSKGGFMMNNRVNGMLAVTRALGDASMKEFIIGNPYTTETQLGKDDTFLILACDGLWDVCTDQEAIDLVSDVQDPQVAAAKLVKYALNNYSTDNITVIVVQFNEAHPASNHHAAYSNELHVPNQPE